MMDWQLAKLTKAGIREVKRQHNRLNHKECNSIFHYIYPTRCNFTQFIYIWKLLYMFLVVTPPIIRSAYNCIYSIWYLSHRYCYLPLSWRTSNSSTIAAGCSNGVTNTRCCRYSSACSWWWVEVPPETCKVPDAVDTVLCAPDDRWRYHQKHVEQFPDINKLCKFASCWIYTGI